VLMCVYTPWMGRMVYRGYLVGTPCRQGLERGRPLASPVFARMRRTRQAAYPPVWRRAWGAMRHQGDGQGVDALPCPPGA
jgi:hypothetical protein